MKWYRLFGLGLLIIFASLALVASLERKPPQGLSLPVTGVIPGEPTSSLARIWIRSGEKNITLQVSENNQLQPRQLLAQAGVELSPGDVVTVNGVDSFLDEPLPPANIYSIQVRPAVRIRLVEGVQARELTSATATLGQALAEAGIPLFSADRLVPLPETPLKDDGGVMEAHLYRAVMVRVHTSGKEIDFRTSAATVGEALAQAGVPLQGLDYSHPPPDAPIPLDGKIQVIRVQEKVLVDLEAQPFETRTEPAPDLELDTRQTIQDGVPGLLARRTRVRLEDGREVSRQVEEQWLAKAPQDKVIGYGTKIVIRTLDTPGGPIEYWRKVQMYATSYSPCRIFKDRCDDSTALGAKLQHGVVAMTNDWCRYTCGDQVYVPGYGVGVVADTGGGIPGRYWIDLGYSDQDYVSWHQWVTVYFLAPVPANYQLILP